MYVSDCHRYLYNNSNARDAAQLMRLVAPSDPEAHMRLALTGAQVITKQSSDDANDDNNSMVDEDSKLAHFFHFCAFLSNRSVPLNHQEATVVRRFVASCRSSLPTDDFNSIQQTIDNTFSARFIDVVWSCLTDTPEESIEKVRNQKLWTSFESVLNSAKLTQKNYFYIAAALMFTSYYMQHMPHAQPQKRKQPSQNKEMKEKPEIDVVDELIARSILLMSRNATKGLHSVSSNARRRRKNCRRSLQKKRRSNITTVNNNPENKNNMKSPNVATMPVQPKLDETISSDVLHKAFEVDSEVPCLGALSFLCSFWSFNRRKHNAAPEVLEILKEILLSLRETIETMKELTTISLTDKLADHVAKKLIPSTPTSTLFPALTEDIAFQHFAPCMQLDTLSGVVKHNVALASLLAATKNDNDKMNHKKGTGDDDGEYTERGEVQNKNKNNSEGVLKEVLKKMNEKTYESVTGQTSIRHLEAFSLQRAKEVAGWSTIASKESLSKVVTLTIRRVRLSHLVNDLERVHGGTLLHYAMKEMDRMQNKGYQKDQSIENNEIEVIERRNRKETDLNMNVGKVHKQLRITSVSKEQQNDDSNKLNRQKRAQNENPAETKNPTCGVHSIQERISESDLEHRAYKRRKLQGAFSFGSGTPVVPGESHESSDIRRQFHHHHPSPLSRKTPPTPSPPQILVAPLPLASAVPLELQPVLHLPADTPIRRLTQRKETEPEPNINNTAANPVRKQHQSPREREDNSKEHENDREISSIVVMLNRIKRGDSSGLLSTTLCHWLRESTPNVSPPSTSKSVSFWKSSPSDDIPRQRLFK